MTNVTSLIGRLLAAVDAPRRARSETGASAVEWAIIAAIGLGVVICVVGLVLQD